MHMPMPMRMQIEELTSCEDGMRRHERGQEDTEGREAYAKCMHRGAPKIYVPRALPASASSVPPVDQRSCVMFRDVEVRGRADTDWR